MSFVFSGEEELGTSEESGKDWSELEDEAREADKNQTDYVDDSIRKKKAPLPKRGYDKHRSPHKNGHSSSSDKRKRDESRDKGSSKHSSSSSKKFRK